MGFILNKEGRGKVRPPEKYSSNQISNIHLFLAQKSLSKKRTVAMMHSFLTGENN